MSCACVSLSGCFGQILNTSIVEHDAKRVNSKPKGMRGGLNTKSLKTIPFCKAFLEVLVLCYMALNGKLLRTMPRGGYGTGCLWLYFVVLFVLKKTLPCLLLFVCFCVW